MNIYIDESGNFLQSRHDESRVSCVAALILPSNTADVIFNKFSILLSRWQKKHTSEIKGSKLSESQMDEALLFMASQEIYAEIFAIDMAMHKDSQITTFKERQADAIVANIADETHFKMVEHLQKSREEVLNLSNQLLVQLILNFQLLLRVLETAPLYYCRTRPEELGRFRWVVDAKAQKGNITKYEKLWKHFNPGFISPICKPFLVAGADYSYLKNFIVEKDDIPYRWPWLHPSGSKDIFLNTTKIFQEKFEFKDSSEEVGLQLVDILASCFTRAMNGKLGRAGYKNLGSLFLRRPHGTIQLIALHKDPISTPRNYRQFVIDAIEDKAIPISRIIGHRKTN